MIENVAMHDLPARKVIELSTGRREAVKAVTGREGIDQGPETHVCADGEGRVELRIVLGRAGFASAGFFGSWRAPLGGDLEDVGPISFLPMGGVGLEALLW